MSGVTTREGDSAAPRAPGTRMQRVLHSITRFNISLGSASGISTMLMMLIIVPDVLMRKFLGVTIPAAAEISVLLLIGKIFLGLPGAQASDANFHVSLFTQSMSSANRRRVKLVTLFISVFIIALLSWLSIKEAIHATLRNEVSFGVVAFPVWPGKIVIAAGFTLLGLQLLVDLVREKIGAAEHVVEGQNAFKVS